jgi:hypothetical protein
MPHTEHVGCQFKLTQSGERNRPLLQWSTSTSRSANRNWLDQFEEENAEVTPVRWRPYPIPPSHPRWS